MPGSVRSGIEDLFKARKIRYICCTSTLLQGVNLPARHIVIEAPERGDDKPMGRADFLNLAGRAGRLKREFHGNVWCLMPDRWAHRCYEGEPLQEIRSSFDRVMQDGGTAIRQALEDDTKMQNAEIAVAAMGRVFTEFVQKDRSLDPLHVGSRESLTLTVELLERLRSEVLLPQEIFTRNTGVHPRRLEALYAHFLKQDELDGFCPIAPFRPGVKDRLKEIFQCVQRFFSGVENNSYTQHVKVALNWIHETPLSTIISNEVSYRRTEAQKAGKRFKPRPIIYGIIDTIEREIRFRYVKHLRAYHDVLEQALLVRGAVTHAEALVSMHLFLECGASKPVTLNLISLGLSRMSALLLARRIILPADSTPEHCLRLCREAIANAPGMKLPGMVKREVAAFVGGG
jgi:hypothetical protein